MPVAVKHDTYPIRKFRNSEAFEKWLGKNHGKSEGIWLKIAKVSSGVASITHAEALEVGLCYGWIDGLRRRLDDDYFLQKYTPRRSNSNWSAINKRKVAALVRSGKMRAAGRAAIELAKRNGRWTAG
jgi:uncharacterized protein YdeI (YjbR/CyaY-like superfamily)